MRADASREVLATPGQDSFCLEYQMYQMYLLNAGTVELETIVGPPESQHVH
jgi:hypothetical protein